MSAGHNDTFHHIRDAVGFELPFGKFLELPNILGLQITKFMVLQVVVLVLSFLIFRSLAKAAHRGQPVRGRWLNFWETIAVFVRDEVVRPAVGTGHHDHDDHGDEHGDHHEDGGFDDPGTGHGPYESPLTHEDEAHIAVTGGGSAAIHVGHPADVHLPFVWTVFFYILFCNLLGAIPWLGSATGHISVTAALAIATFIYVIRTGVQTSGAVGFLKSIAPTMDIPGIIGPPVKALIWVIEFVGILIKHAVLAVRLFANIMAGHTVIAVILGFIAQTAVLDQSWIFYVVTPASVLGQIAIGLLELFVAFLQAYVFSLLASLFIGMVEHPH